MKKAVFTIQMLVLMAIFPVYLVAELNHETGKSPVTNSTLEFTERPVESNIQTETDLTESGLSLLVIKEHKSADLSQKINELPAECLFLTYYCLLRP